MTGAMHNLFLLFVRNRAGRGCAPAIFDVSGLAVSLVLALFLCACANGRKAFNPNKKYPLAGLRQDYRLFQTILEEKHPSLYWYSSKYQMDSAFEAGRLLLKDSMTEYEFRKVLTLVTSTIQCGHTSVRASKQYQKHFELAPAQRSFPLNIKTWDDTIVLTAPVKNTPLLRGDIIDSINGISSKHLLDTLLRFVPADGNNIVAKSQLLSGTSYFSSLYTAVFGWPQTFSIAYKDSAGSMLHTTLKPAVIIKDSLFKTGGKAGKEKPEKTTKARLKEQRRFQLVGSGGYALMELNSFSGSRGLKSFFRKSFRTLADSGITNLIIDLRLNGGGKINNSTDLTRYLADKPFKIGDSIFAKKPSFKYGRFIKNNVAGTLFTWLSTKKISGQYHFRHFENKYYSPKKKHHYNGQVYILTGGYTYSASVLFLNAVQHQSNVTIVGEPSGGAAYGNTAMIIPDVTLPRTKVRFRLPLFRLVIDKDNPKNGKGIEPDVYIGTTPEAIKKGMDVKMKKAQDLIKAKTG